MDRLEDEMQGESWQFLCLQEAGNVIQHEDVFVKKGGRIVFSESTRECVVINSDCTKFITLTPLADAL